ncbi:lipid-binding SYLF domain-containing protein [Namhaeicola litoreus]|uniref:YSC84-related protein n=1 Tax=Namhaeicola litoreus TaxID=1052145 RepID=A0ABW3Y599_9FLAO
MNQLTQQFKRTFFFMMCLIAPLAMNAQVGGWKPELTKEAQAAISEIEKDYPNLKDNIKKAYGYAIFPKITKAGLGVGGAGGKGVVYQGGKITGEATMSQASIGLQAGGQQYSEIIFFENKEAYDHFTNGKLKFDGQASAVALEKGASIDVAYKDGVAVYTKAIGGLMFEASLGGQHFKFKAK